MGFAANLARIARFLTADAVGNLAATQTPPQFDTDLSVPTTEFVQRALGNKQKSILIPASTTLNAADAGSAFIAQGAAPITITLPALASVPTGASFEINSQSANGVTIQRSGADVLSANNTNSALTSMAVLDGESVRIVKLGTSSWVVQGLSKYDANFASIKAIPGYQKLPSGLILQWGRVDAVTASSSAPVVFPIPFPNALLCPMATIMNTGGQPAAMAAGVSSGSVNGMTVFHNGNTTPTAISWLAIGY